MTSSNAILLAILLLCLQACDSAPPEHADIAARAAQYDAVIRRDVRGVPHILGTTDADAAFGLAYAQAEDHWSLIEASLPFYRGENGRFVGVDGAVTDYLVHWLGIWPAIEARYTRDLSADTRAYLEAFADGLNYYAVMHPEAVDARVLPVTAQDIVAGHMLRHLLFYGFEQTVSELNQPTRQHPVSRPDAADQPLSAALFDALPIGSNAFATAPTLSSDGATRIAINSHQPTTGPVAWYEAHLTSRAGLQVMGGLFPSSPFINVGFTPTTAWGATVNKPDLVDVYVLEINPENPYQYRLNGQWHELERAQVELNVTLWGFLPWRVSREILHSAHGPVLQTEHGSYAVRYAGMGEIRQVEQWYAMNRARDLTQWQDAMAMQSFASFNFVYADHAGNIFFVHNALTPRRQPGYNWRHYVPGNDAALIWTETLPFAELPQVLNPASGFVFSANQTPFVVTATPDNPDPQQYPAELGFQQDMTNRAYRGLELMTQLSPISAADFHAIKHDKYYSRQTAYVQYLERIAAADFDDAQLAAAQTLLRNWDLGTDVDNRAAALGTCVLLAAERDTDRDSHDTTQVAALLRSCTDPLWQHYQRLDPRWGEVNRHVRGALNLPVGGGPDILRAIYGRRLNDEPFLTNVAGDGLYYLITWDQDGQQQVLGVHQFGSATLDPQSPHYADQVQAYVDEQLHPAPFTESEVEAALLRSYRPGEQ